MLAKLKLEAVDYHTLVKQLYPEADVRVIEGVFCVTLGPTARPCGCGDTAEEAWEDAYRSINGKDGGILRHILKKSHLANPRQDLNLSPK